MENYVNGVAFSVKFVDLYLLLLCLSIFKVLIFT